MTGKSKATDGALDVKAGATHRPKEDTLRRMAGLAALPPPTGEPVAWQYRYKHKASDKWSKWGDYDPALAGYSDWTKETRPLYAAPPQVEPAEGAASKFRLWFFRDLVPNDRRALFSLFGMPTDEITNHGAETLALRYILKALAAAPHQSGESSNG